MKLEEFLMRPSEGQSRRLTLENEVEELQERLETELKLNSVLRWAMKGPVLSFHCLPPELPFQVKVLLTELAVAEEQIMWLEREVRKLKLTLNHQHKSNNSARINLVKLQHQHSRHSSLDDRRIGNDSHDQGLNHMSPRTYGMSRFNAPWRPNAYLC